MDHRNKKDNHDDCYDTSNRSRYKSSTVDHAYVIIEILRCSDVVRNMDFIDPNCVG